MIISGGFEILLLYCMEDSYNASGSTFGIYYYLKEIIQQPSVHVYIHYAINDVKMKQCTRSERMKLATGQSIRLCSQ